MFFLHRPESLGIVPATVHIVVVIVFQLFYYTAVGPNNKDSVWLVKLEEYNAALAATIFMVLLGFADDVLELRWRYKVLIRIETVSALRSVCIDSFLPFCNIVVSSI
jgi:UDP-N-acetylglucosamine--dolichyl-phosphate N-acetylglucosaminephosphotransferase